MIIVERVRELETKIERLVSLMTELRSTNEVLDNKLRKAESLADELSNKLEKSETARQTSEQNFQRVEKKLEKYQSDQQQIEATISRALDQLDGFENSKESSPTQLPQTSDNSNSLTDTSGDESVKSTSETLLSDQQDLNDNSKTDAVVKTKNNLPTKSPTRSADHKNDDNHGSELDIF